MAYWRAVLAHSDATHHQAHIPDYAKVDEIPFDLERRIMSVVVRTPEGKDRIISKGALEAIFPRRKNFELDGELSPMEHVRIDELRHEYEQLGTPAVGVRRRSAATTHHVRTSRPTGSSAPLRTGWACLRAYPA
jgi:magnesium-transporting ATPase (P-type)